MEGFCKACLVKYKDSSNLYQYSEKNRRLFVYSTGLQVKRNDNIVFQICKDCYVCMKNACNFKKNCRNADKKLRRYFALKEDGDSIDLCSYLKNNDDSLKFRLPLTLGSSTPTNQRRDDDNESTCTSIQNFMTDILPPGEIPDNEAKIIREVIEEEADILEDSLDSHWLQDDTSIDTDLDFSFSQFSTPRSVNNDYSYTPKKQNGSQDIIKNYNTVQNILENNDEADKEDISLQKLLDTSFESPIVGLGVDNICSIDLNLDNALKKDAENVPLETLLATPPVRDDISGPPTPLITNILFGDRIDDEEFENKDPNKQIDDDMEFIDEFLTNNIEEEITEATEWFDEKKNVTKEVIDSIESEENKYCITNFYCKMCNRKFENLKGLKIHFNKYHKIKIKSETPSKKPTRRKMICNYCGKVFQTPRCIIKHLENHNLPTKYKCRYCPLKFSSQAKVELHTSTHTGIQNKKKMNAKYVCMTCGKSFASSSNYNMHVRRHAGAYTRECAHCGMGFYRNSDLASHMRCHTGERPFRCTLCTLSFSRTDVLNRHMKTHTGERPFPCNFCDKKYKNSYELKLHIKTNKCSQSPTNVAEERSHLVQALELRIQE